MVESKIEIVLFIIKDRASWRERERESEMESELDGVRDGKDETERK